MNWIIPGVLAYVLHEMAHVLAMLLLGVPFLGVEVRRFGICINRAIVNDWRDYAVSSAGMIANLAAAVFAIFHGDPWFSFANVFMFCFAGLGDIRNIVFLFQLDKHGRRR